MKRICGTDIYKDTIFEGIKKGNINTFQQVKNTICNSQFISVYGGQFHKLFQLMSWKWCDGWIIDRIMINNTISMRYAKLQ